jgi:hypothetical protein
VGGQHYGPGTPNPEPSDDVARQITNPLAWEDGKVPFPAEEPAGESSAPDTAPAPSEARGGDEKAESAEPHRASRARKKG